MMASPKRKGPPGKATLKIDQAGKLDQHPQHSPDDAARQAAEWLALHWTEALVAGPLVGQLRDRFGLETGPACRAIAIARTLRAGRST